jgi:hypothetical protein
MMEWLVPVGAMVASVSLVDGRFEGYTRTDGIVPTGGLGLSHTLTYCPKQCAALGLNKASLAESRGVSGKSAVGKNGRAAAMICCDKRWLSRCIKTDVWKWLRCCCFEEAKREEEGQEWQAKA